MQPAVFGKTPSGSRLERVRQSPHYKDGQFHNLSYTPTLAEGYHMAGVLYTQLFKKAKHKIPSGIIPSVKTDLHKLSKADNLLVWFGHSSYLLQTGGKRLLIDPVFSGHASPIPRMVKAFKGANTYGAADMPDIDYLLITHDHYDHADYKTLVALKDKVGKVICGLGVGAHFDYWGYEPERIIEADWYETALSEDGICLHAMPARHFSGRMIERNKTLWLSYVLQSRGKNIYIGGDSGYDWHFKSIGEQFGPFDLAILDNGQYNEAWRYIHMLPEETLRAAQDLRTQRLMPVHSSKFALGNHPWYEPLTKVSELNAAVKIPLVTPLIGQVVYLDDTQQSFERWWEQVD